MQEATSVNDYILLATTFDGIIATDSKSTAPDITAALNQLFASISAYSSSTKAYNKVHFPKGYYRITGPVEITRSTISGDNNVNFILDGPDACIKVVPYGDYPSSYEVFIQGITLTGINGAKVGLSITNGSQFCLRDVSLFHFETGIELIHCDISHISRPTIQYCNVGILFNYTTSISITQADFFANHTDNKFLEYNSGITFSEECYSENAAYAFLFDSTDTFTSCTNINVIGCTFATGEYNSQITGTEAAVLKVNGKAHSASLKGFNFIHNRIFLNHSLSKYVFIITTEDISPRVALLINGNTFYNQQYPHNKIILTNASDYFTTCIIYQDNINTDGAFDILEGKSSLTGLDRSGTTFSYANRLHGALVLDTVPNIDISHLPGAIYFNQWTNQIEYVGNDGKIYALPKPAPATSLSTARNVSELKADLNKLITKLIDAGVISSS